MVRQLLRIPLFRVLAPRLAAPLLPITRLRPSTSALTNTPRSTHTRLFSQFNARLNSSPPSPKPSSSSESEVHAPPDATLSQRLKHLIKSYGWYALGVYLVFSTIDFCIAFALINVIGAEHVSKVTTAVKSSIAELLHSKPPEPGLDELDSPLANQISSGNESLYAMIVLAYTVHKTLFLPVRVGLTAFFTPRLVGWLRTRGWAGGAGTRRAATEMRERMRSPKNRSNRD